jgi:scytalone dehydratase
MPADYYVEMMATWALLGDPLLKTQHFFGASKSVRISEDAAIGYHQGRTPHMKFTDTTFSIVDAEGTGHGTNTHWYRMIDGIWKFAGLCPEIRFGTSDFKKLVDGVREKHATP